MIIYAAIGTSLATLTNFSTYFTYPPNFVDERRWIPLTGQVRRRVESGRVRRDGFIDADLHFDVMQVTELEAFMYTRFAGFTTASVYVAVSLMDESGHYSPFLGYLEKPRFTPQAGGALHAPVVFPLSGLQLQSVTKTANYTVTTSDRLVYGNTASGSVTLTLPNANAAGANTVFSFVKTAAANNLVIDGDGSQLVGGASTQTLTALYSRLDIVSDGSSAWTVI